MSLSTGYLTQKQRLIWGLKSSGKQEANIARELKVTRQTVHKAINTANTRIGESLTEAAQLNKIEIQTIDTSKGFLSGYSFHFKTQAFVTFSAKNGIQIWYKHEGNCKKCKRLKTCQDMLVAEANERNFLLTEDVNEILQSKLADALFSKISGGPRNETAA
jgi:DNA-binding CsgD family transcriptional regulator